MKPKHTYKLTGSCAKTFSFDIDDEGHLSNCSIEGGCGGNTKAIARLLEGIHIGSAIVALEGIPCTKDGTSCPNEIASALSRYLKRNEE